MIAPLVRRVHWEFEFQFVAFHLRQNVASDNSEPFGIVMMDAFAPLADCIGSGTCLGTADFEVTTGSFAVEQLKAYFKHLVWYCSSQNYFAIYFCVCCLYWLVVVHNRCFGLADSSIGSLLFIIVVLVWLTTLTAYGPILFGKRIRLFLRLLS